MNLSHNYISIPRRLVGDLRDNPLAVALYFLVARLYLIHQRPVPLSRGDIRQYDPEVKVGAIKRALDRLVAEGWLSEHAGYKRSYTPNWGSAKSGAIHSWHIGAPLLGCPMHIWCAAVRGDRNLLDVCLERTPVYSRTTRPAGIGAKPTETPWGSKPFTLPPSRLNASV